MNRKRINTDYGEYYVYEDGRVVLDKPYKYKTKTGKSWFHKQYGELNITMSNSGYKQVRLHDNKFYVHRLVAEYFVDGNHDLMVDHIDGDKTNNHYTNLEWVTGKENARRAWKNGLGNRDSSLRKKQAPLNAKKGKIHRLKHGIVLYDLNGNLISHITKSDIAEHDKKYYDIPHSVYDRITHKGRFIFFDDMMLKRFGCIPNQIELKGAMKNPSKSSKNRIITREKDGIIESFVGYKSTSTESRIIVKSFMSGMPDKDGWNWFIHE